MESKSVSEIMSSGEEIIANQMMHGAMKFAAPIMDKANSLIESFLGDDEKIIIIRTAGRGKSAMLMVMDCNKEFELIGGKNKKFEGEEDSVIMVKTLSEFTTDIAKGEIKGLTETIVK